MDPIALVLVAASAGMHATWNYLAKRATDSLAFLCALSVLSPFIAGGAMLIEWWLLGTAPDFSTWKLAILSGFIQASYFMFTGTGYNRGDLSVVYPLSRGVAPVFIAILGVLFLKDSLSPFGSVGILLVLLGTLALASDAIRNSGDPGEQKKRTSLRSYLGSSVGLGLLAAVSIALYHVVDKAGAQGATVTSYLFMMNTMMLVALTPLMLKKRRAQAIRTVFTAQRVRMIISAVLVYSAYMLVVAAMMRAPAAYVATARNLSILIGIGLGAVRLQEGRAGLRLGAGAVMLTGMTVLALGA
jgi:drug/metabolite transporter (DMT)-like permease